MTNLISSARVHVLEGARGPARREALDRHLAGHAARGARTWTFSCDFDLGGPWAGVNDFLSSLIGDISHQRPDLAQRHAFELIHVLPALSKTLKPSYASLTDTAPPEERVRNYAADRAFRLVHGLIDLLASWKTVTSPDVAWCIACDDYDRAGAIGRYFFRELMRRRGGVLNIHLIAVVDQGNGSKTLFDSATNVDRITLNLPAYRLAVQQVHNVTRKAAARWASELERHIETSNEDAGIHLSDLIRLWRLADRPDKLLQWKSFAVGTYLHLGLYEDATRYSQGLLSLADEQAAPDETSRLWILIKTLSGYMGTSDTTAGMQFVENQVLPALETPNRREHIDLFFLAAMMYARFSKPRDLAKGEELLDRGIAALDLAPLREEERQFLYVFNRNGVAMIRSFQGRLPEAIELCRAGIERLNRHLGSLQHRLHRSVLVYNIAQVYVAMGAHVEALEHYTTVITLDPDYSEYYNERGNIFLRIGKLEEARADYLEAIRLSPPYFEVHTNLGQCYRRMRHFEEAVTQYNRALDLKPGQTLALVGRAKANEELGQRIHAIEDYSVALSLEPEQWEVLASRGVLYYETGDLEASLADFNSALRLAPEQPDLQTNHSIVRADLARQNVGQLQEVA